MSIKFCGQTTRPVPRTRSPAPTTAPVWPWKKSATEPSTAKMVTTIQPLSGT